MRSMISTIRQHLRRRRLRQALRSRAPLAGRFQQRHAVAVGVLGEPVDRLAADAARRRVDRPLERHVVARVVDQLAVGEHVLDFLAGVELLPADHLVRHAGRAAAPAPARATGRSRDRRSRSRSACAGPPRSRCESARRCRPLRDPGRRTRPAAPARLRRSRSTAPSACGAGCGRSARRRRAGSASCCGSSAPAARSRTLGIVVLELEDVVEVGPAPAVDRLVRIARDRQVRIVDRQRPQDHVLRPVRVLVLVDQHVAIPLVELGADLRRARTAAARRAAAGRRSRRPTRPAAAPDTPDRPRPRRGSACCPARGSYWSARDQLVLGRADRLGEPVGRDS